MDPGCWHLCWLWPDPHPTALLPTPPSSTQHIRGWSHDLPSVGPMPLLRKWFYWLWQSQKRQESTEFVGTGPTTASFHFWVVWCLIGHNGRGPTVGCRQTAAPALTHQGSTTCPLTSRRDPGGGGADAGPATHIQPHKLMGFTWFHCRH